MKFCIRKVTILLSENSVLFHSFCLPIRSDKGGSTLLRLFVADLKLEYSPLQDRRKTGICIHFIRTSFKLKSSRNIGTKITIKSTIEIQRTTNAYVV